MKILLIEDNKDHCELIQEYCHLAFYEGCEIDTYDRLDVGLSKLYKDVFDVILLDLSLPDSNVQATTYALKNINVSIPIIVLTSLHDESLGKELIKNGAQDFLPKDSLNKMLLQRTINYAIERKNRQVQLEQRAINQQTFCRSLSHDFKAPIRNIGQLTLMLKNQLNDRKVLNDEDYNLFSKIDERLKIMNRLVDGLYHYILTEELEEPSGELVDLNNIMKELVILFSNESDKNISIKYDKLPIIKGNDTQIFLLLQNLLENSIKFCNIDPIIRISVIHKSDNTLNDNFPHRIKICDNGIGIEDTLLNEIFQPFRRLHSDYTYPGSGLGLSVVERIISNHNGNIMVQSELNKGTCITLAFP